MMTPLEAVPPVYQLQIEGKHPELARELKGKEWAVLEQGSELTVIRRDSGPSVYLGGGLTGQMKSVGRDLWAIRYRIPELERAFFTFHFEIIRDQAVNRVDGILVRGPRAPAAPPEVDSLKGKLTEVSVAGRKASVYIPPGKVKGPLRTLYLSDGQSTEQYAKVVEALVVAGKLKPLALVGIHSGDSDLRAREYQPGYDGAAFEAHLNLVETQIMPQVEKEFGLSSRREDRYLMGFSHGGGFVEVVGLIRPKLFSRILAIAPTVEKINPTYVEMAKSSGPKPEFFVSAGYLDDFHRNAPLTSEHIRSMGAKVVRYDAYGAHDLEYGKHVMTKWLKG
jgi:hypothetical protein